MVIKYKIFEGDKNDYHYELLDRVQSFINNLDKTRFVSMNSFGDYGFRGRFTTEPVIIVWYWEE